jgi:lipopolysaccharide transport system ATP-binding protein
MSLPAIEARGLGKQYRIGEHLIGQYGRLTESLTRLVSSPLRALRGKPAGSAETDEIWAVRDIDLSVYEGEVMGVVGRNGAGKTTLLKLFSRITEPTEGEAVLRGRVGSLLEVGTGFHAELTGRENVLLSGAILGMSRREILGRFDEIVEFSELQRFMDTPVKRYSSGMYMRLAFAVAAHLEPDILIVDEVLAVGDAAFQRRCLGKMEESAHEGRTVLFVSHNMQAVGTLCQRAVYLENGRVKLIDDAQAVVQDYLEDVSTLSAECRWEEGDRPGDSHARLSAVRVTTGDGKPAVTVFSSQAPVIEIECDIEDAAASLAIGFDLETTAGATVLSGFHTDGGSEPAPRLRRGSWLLRCELPASLLNAGGYTVSPRIGVHGAYQLLRLESVVHFEVVHDASHQAFSGLSRPGTVAPQLSWSLEPG